MYHADQSHIITTDDYDKLNHLSLQKGDKYTYATMVVRLRPDKEYTEEGLRLHVTNGVSHRYLMPEPEEVEVVTAEEQSEDEKSSEEGTTTEENPNELAVAPATHAARRQSKKDK